MPNSTWRCGEYSFPLGAKTYVMGIVNATPDSFSGDGIYNPKLGRVALERALQMVDDGADILDIGGESTRPGAAPVSLEEEKQRLLPLLEILTAKTKIPISIDTTKSEMARAAIDAGASIINDISGGTFDEKMLGVLGTSRCGLVLMHLRGTPQTMKASSKVDEKKTTKQNVIEEILEFWSERIAAARGLGICDERICLDAGFGFGKSVEENLEILRRGEELCASGFPVLSATSRKSTIGKVLVTTKFGDAPVEERLFGTAATVAIAIHNGADIVRVHDVREMAQVARMTDAIVRR